MKAVYIKKILTLLFLFLDYSLFGQEAYLDSTFREVFSNDSVTEIYILGEHHDMNNVEHQFSFLKYLHENKNVNSIGLELPLTDEFVINDYLLNDIPLNKSYLNYGSEFRTNNLCRLIELIKEYNSIQNDTNKISVFCFDEPASKNLFFFLQKFNLIFGRVEGINKLYLNKYLNCSKKKIKGLKARSIVFELTEDFKRNREQYLLVLMEKFTIYEKMLEGLNITFPTRPVNSEARDSLREAYIYRQVSDKINIYKNILIFTGNSHASFGKPRYIFWNINKFYSFSYHLRQQYGKKVFTIITQYFFSSHEKKETNLLSREMKDYFNLHEQYIVVSDLVLHPLAARHADMVLIKNCMNHTCK